MPVIKSAKKSMRQSLKRKANRLPLRNQLKTVFNNTIKQLEAGKAEEVKKNLPYIFSVIDKACKKHMIPGNTADRKKSRIAKTLNILEKKGAKA